MTKAGQKIALIAGMGGKRDRALAGELLDGGMVVELFVHGEKGAPDFPSQVQATSLDMTDEKQITEALQSVAKRRKKVDYLINCPDAPIDRLLWETPEKEWEECLALNLTSVFLLCKHVTPLMMEQGEGRIINVSSDAGRMGAVGAAAYAAAKAGLNTFSKALARETAPSGIRVNVVSLGMMEEEIGPLGAETDISGIPLKRAGRWEEAACLVHFLLDDGLEYLTGQIVHVNGGLFMP